MNSINLIKKGKKILMQKGIPSSTLDSELILANLFNFTKEKILTQCIDNISNSKVEKFKNDIIRRSKFEPIAYIINKREFWKNEFYIQNQRS